MSSGFMDLHFHYALQSEEPRQNMSVYNAVDNVGNRVRVYKVTEERLFLQIKHKLKKISEHPNFERFLLCDFAKSNDRFEGYFVFERYEGVSFKRAMREIAYPLQLIILAELANGIRYLHEVGIIHGAILDHCLYSKLLRIPVITEPLGGCLQPSQPAPEQESNPQNLVPGTDVWHMADYIALASGNHRGLHALIKSCRAVEPGNRPSPAIVSRELRQIYTEEVCKADISPWRSRIMRLAKIAGVGLFVTAGFLAADYRNQQRLKQDSAKRETVNEEKLNEARKHTIQSFGNLYYINKGMHYLPDIIKKLENHYGNEFSLAPQLKGKVLEVAKTADWITILELNQINWKVNADDEIHLFSSVGSHRDMSTLPGGSSHR